MVNIKSEPAGKGRAWVEEYDSYMSTLYVPKGESVKLKCVPGEGYVFAGWAAEGKTLSTDPAINFTPGGDTSLSMLCRKLDSSTPKTGDGSEPGLWLGLMGLSALALGGGAAACLRKRKQRG